MNKGRLMFLEHKFMSAYPQGFESEEMKLVSKKHRLGKISDFVHSTCSKENLLKGLDVVDDLIKVVTKSTMVSVFEKMRFRDLVREFDNNEKLLLVDAIYDNIHGNEEEGFNQLVDLLSPYKLAKWPLITVWRAYYNLNDDVFMKPTTVKKIIQFLELDDIQYIVKPNFELYSKYRVYINTMKKEIDKRLSPNNPAFSGFLMVTID